MKLKVLNPDSDLTIEQLHDREKRMLTIARPDTVIEMECQKDTHVCVDSALDVAVTSMELIQKAIQAEKEGFDVIGIYCAEDPAISACREMVSIPVIGGGQTSLQIAMGLGYRFSWITSEKTPIMADNFIKSSGIDYGRLASIRCMNIDIVAARNSDPKKIVDALIDLGKECIQKDGAQVLVLGCLVFAGMGREVAKILDVPVVDPAFSIVSMAELYYHQGLSHSKIAYPTPPAGERTYPEGKIKI